MNNTQDLLQVVAGYAALGWCIIPIREHSKKPSVQWERFQAERPGTEDLRKWFGAGPHNVAVVLGPVSGGLACRDFDVEGAYDRWVASCPKLARTLPTVQTARGAHVYCRGHFEGIRDLGDGELRGSRGYCLLPPSVHPDGPTYTWLIEPSRENLLEVDAQQAGFLDVPALCTERTERTESTETTEQDGENRGERRELRRYKGEVERIIQATLPFEIGTRHRRIFDLARHLHSSPQFAGADPKDLRWIVEGWYERALPMMRTKDFTETWIDFLRAWPKVRYARGESPMEQAFKQAALQEPPRIAVERYPENRRLQVLVGICRDLQRRGGREPWFLSCRTAGSLLGVTHTEASRWLFLLEADGILEVVEKGGGRQTARRATRYRYVGDKGGAK